MFPKRKRDGDQPKGSEPRKRIRMGPVDAYVRQANKNQEDIEYRRGWMDPKAAGSSFSEAYLGPDSLNERNSDANPRLPSGIDKARAAFPDVDFKAGHMINACFGGNGQKANNLTILTSSANTSMNFNDNRLKNAVRKLRKLFETFHKAKIDLDDIGKCRIKLRVEVSGDKWGDNPPASYIDKWLKITAKFENDPEDRSGFMQEDGEDDESPEARAARKQKLIDEIEDLQEGITNLVVAACGWVDNRYGH
jgi:hypothetical protein